MSVVIDSAAPVPAVARTRVGHQRLQPFRYRFTHRSTAWLVDADRPQEAFPGPLRHVLTIHAADHLGTEAGTWGQKVRTHVRDRGLDWTAARVLVLTNARTFGHVFDPLTTYFCFDVAGRLEGVLAEVHNTYGGRHTYPLGVDPREGRASTGKQFYVSPFFAVEGRYDIRARLDRDQVSVAITLSQADGSGGERRVFSGYVTGDLVPATRTRVWRAFLRDPFASQRVSTLIRWHGIRLWLRRLPVVPRHRSHHGERNA